MLSIGSSDYNHIRELSPCSDDDNDEEKLMTTRLDSNRLWESPISQSTSAIQITIKTKFDSSLPQNQHLICPPKEQRQNRFDFTLRERKRAEQAKVPSSVEDMENMVSFFSVSITLLKYINYLIDSDPITKW
jgi:hypothetical protein